MILKLVNNVTKREMEFRVYDVNDSNLFYHFALTLGDTNPDDGEYTYRLMNDDLVLANGLLQIGDYQNNAKKYTDTNARIKQYNG